MRPQVLLVFMTILEESTTMLKGIALYTRSHRAWQAFLDDEARAEADPRWLRSKPWAGVISRHTTPLMVRECAALNIPLVDLSDSEPYPGVPKFRPDNFAIGHLGAEHFLERGFRHLAFSGFGNCGWARERRDGFVEAARLEQREVNVFDVDYPGDLTPTWDEQQVRELAVWLAKLPKPAGVMACNDMRALQVIAAAQTAQLLVPEQVAILGANNDAVRCDLSYPPLSSVATDPFQSGHLAAEMLDRMMRGLPAERTNHRVDPRGVVTRHSTDVLAVDDRNVAAALSYIREHACDGITVDQVLRHAAASRSQLEKKFRRYLGRSPQAEIRRVQIERIRRLLVETEYPLKKIAELAGFEHVEYMSVVFKRLTALTPGEFRRRHQDARRRI
jgi:LacI family transcriptional regulator